MMIKKQPTLLNKLQYLLGVKRQNNSFFIKKKMVKQKAQLILKRITKKKSLLSKDIVTELKAKRKEKRKKFEIIHWFIKNQLKDLTKLMPSNMPYAERKKIYALYTSIQKKKKKKTK